MENQTYLNFLFFLVFFCIPSWSPKDAVAAPIVLKMLVLWQSDQVSAQKLRCTSVPAGGLLRVTATGL